VIVKLEGVLKYRDQITFDRVIANLFEYGFFDPVEQSISSYGEPIGAVFDRVIVLPYATYATLLSDALCEEWFAPTYRSWLLRIDHRGGDFLADGRVDEIRFLGSKDWFKPVLRRADVPEFVRPSYDRVVRCLAALRHIWEKSDGRGCARPPYELTCEDEPVLSRVNHAPGIHRNDVILMEYFRCLMHVKYRDIIAPTEKWLRRGCRLWARWLKEIANPRSKGDFP